MGTYAAKDSVQFFRTGILPGEITEKERAQFYKQLRRIDTLESLENRSEESHSVSAPVRVELPQPQKTNNLNYLWLLTEAFSKSFSSMAHGIQAETNDYLGLQKLDETAATAVLLSTTNAIKQDNAQLTLNNQITQYQENMASEGQTAMIVTVCVGIGLTLLTGVGGMLAESLEAGTAIGTNELEMTTLSSDEATTETAENTSEEGNAPRSLDETATSENKNVEEEDSNANTRRNMRKDLDASRNENEKSIREQNKAVRDLRKNFRPNNKTKEILKKIGKTLSRTALKMGAGAAFGTPQLITGIGQYYHLAPQLDALSKLQSKMGDAYEALSLNNTFFQFYQQLAQREGGVLQEQISNVSEVVDTYAGVVQGYRQISYGLADAV